MKGKSIGQLILAIIVCNLVGGIGSLFTFDTIDTWYATLQKPFFSPPNWVFGPVWVTLYTLMGIAFFLILQKGWRRAGVRRAATVFGLQLGLNALWTPIFFGWHMIGLAFLVIVLLCFAIMATIRLFAEENKTAAWLLLPYLLWVAFATVLNGALWYLN